MKKLIVLCLCCLTVSIAFADVIYSNDFESGVGNEWSSTAIEQAPFGQRFLGDWSNASINLSLDNIPSHTEITLELDLYIIYSMDGNNGDLWTLSIQDGPILLSSTFTNPLRQGGGPSQSYPNNYPSSNPAQSGADAINSLGYNTVSNGYINPVFGDSTYHLIYTFAHTSDDIVINFQGSGMQQIQDESWGIDNVSVEAIPEPITSLLILGALPLMRRRKA